MPELVQESLTIIKFLLISLNVTFSLVFAGIILAAIWGTCTYRKRKKRAEEESRKKEEEADEAQNSQFTPFPYPRYPMGGGRDPIRNMPSGVGSFAGGSMPVRNPFADINDLFDEDDEDDDSDGDSENDKHPRNQKHEPENDDKTEADSGAISNNTENDSRTQEKRTKKVYEIPKSFKDGTAVVDPDLKKILERLPSEIILPNSPSPEFVERCKEIYIKNCFCFDAIGELLVQKALEYASSLRMRPILLHGGPGCGKTHRAGVLAEMLNLHFHLVNVPVIGNSKGIAGCAPPYKPALGLIGEGMIAAGYCNFLSLWDEAEKEERSPERPSFSDQFLKLVDQDSARFRDNRLGFDINASHIVHVLTANDIQKVHRPLLDRCDVIEVRPPCQKDMEAIVRGRVIPKAVALVGKKDRISFSEAAINYMLEALWEGEQTSVRRYQNFAEKCVNAANYISICEGRSVVVEVDDVKKHLEQMSIAPLAPKRIGFV
ncbi:MAG: AAA family ATPase [Clostridia bacterium]|nr:AAA family ATPase [Clostridia bacterium]